MTAPNLFNDQPPACPHCETDTAIPVVYREPSEEMMTASQLGLIALSQVPDSLEAPQWKCRNNECGHWF